MAAGNYQDFVEKISIAEVENPAGDLVGGFILGSSDFVNWVKETFLANRSEKREIPQLTELKPKLSPDQVVAAVCDEFNCNTDLILQKGRKKMRNKNIIINN